MQIKSILAAAAIALAASVGSASAADPFTTLEGVQAQPMNAAAMEAVRGRVAIVSNALTIGAGGAPPGGSEGNFNMPVAGPVWLGKAGSVFD